MLWFLKKIPPDKIFPRSYMDFEQKYQKDPGMNKDKDSKLFPQGVTCLFRVEEKEVQLQTTLMQVTRENTLKKF